MSPHLKGNPVLMNGDEAGPNGSGSAERCQQHFSLVTHLTRGVASTGPYVKEENSLFHSECQNAMCFTHTRFFGVFKREYSRSALNITNFNVVSDVLQ